LPALTVQPPGLAIGPGTELPTVRSRPRSRGRGEDASGVVARSRCSAAGAGQCRGAMLARGGVTAAAALTLLRVSMARCSSAQHPRVGHRPGDRLHYRAARSGLRPRGQGRTRGRSALVDAGHGQDAGVPPGQPRRNAADNLIDNFGQLSDHSGAITDAPGCPWTGPSRGPLIPP
jgi:hypothetical protein